MKRITTVQGVAGATFLMVALVLVWSDVTRRPQVAAQGTPEPASLVGKSEDEVRAALGEPDTIEHGFGWSYPQCHILFADHKACSVADRKTGHVYLATDRPSN